MDTAGTSSASNRLVETLTGELARFPEIELAILYGSQASGNARGDSDIDLAVARDARTQLEAERLVEFSLEATRATGKEVQVRDLARADGLFLKQVLTTGRVLVCRRPAVRAELIIRMLDFDADILPNVRMIRRRNRERFLAGS